MLEEVIGILLSFCSIFTSTTPEVRLESGDRTEDEFNSEKPWEVDNARWPPYIHKEYDSCDEDELIFFSRLNAGFYTSLSKESPSRRSVCRSVGIAVRVTIGITLAILPITLATIGYLLIDVNMTELCRLRKGRNDSSTFSVKRFRVIGDSAAAFVNCLWIPLTLIVLFGWKEFKAKFAISFPMSFIWWQTIVIYYLCCLSFGVYGTNVYYMYYRYPGNVLFFVDLMICFIIVVRKIHACHTPSVSYSRVHIWFVISTQIIFSFLIAMAYKYVIVPLYNQQKTEIFKFLVAAIAPIIVVLPGAVCKHIALRRSSEIVHPGRSYVMVYIIHAGDILLFRVMQADFKSIWLFVGLSLLAGFSNFFKKATLRIREKFWTCIIQLLKRTVCCHRLEEMPSNTPRNRRFKADIEIQDMLLEYSSIFLSQAYPVLYYISSFQMSVSSMLYESFRRVAIALSINFVFNCLTNFIQIHYQDIPLRRVYARYWKRHMFANFVVVFFIALYLSAVTLTMFQTQANQRGMDSGRSVATNCSQPFGWL